LFSLYIYIWVYQRVWERVNIFGDGVQGSLCEFGYDSKSEEGSEDDIGEGDEEVWV
jgi:hypothetical protein